VKIKGGMAVVALALLLAGCGGGGDTTVQLTKAQFIKQGDKICAAASEEATKALKDAAANLKRGELFTPAEEEEVVRTKTLPAMQSAAQQLTELAKQTGDQKAEDVAASLEQGIEEAMKHPRQALEPVSSDGKLATAIRRGRERAEAYGFESCPLI
jgi:hypothetical protein